MFEETVTTVAALTEADYTVAVLADTSEADAALDGLQTMIDNLPRQIPIEVVLSVQDADVKTILAEYGVSVN